MSTLSNLTMLRHITLTELQAARLTICKVHGKDPFTVEHYLDHLTVSNLKSYDSAHNGIKVETEDAVRFIRQLGGPNGYTILKAYEARHGAPDWEIFKWHR